jgi:hypothetical protein
VCGRCAANHRTGDCPVTDSGTFACSNCKVSGHGAVDRACPVFQREQERRRARDPTAGYRYIPTNDPRTWATAAAVSTAGNGDGAVPARGGVGNGRLAGGHFGQGGGAPVDDGWNGRRARATAAAGATGNQWSADGLHQPTIADAFGRQPGGSQGRVGGLWGRTGAGTGAASTVGAGSGSGAPAGALNEAATPAGTQQGDSGGAADEGAGTSGAGRIDWAADPVPGQRSLEEIEKEVGERAAQVVARAQAATQGPAAAVDGAQ